MKSIKQILDEKGIKRDYRNSFEFQAYGNFLAQELQDIKHRTLYIKFAKTIDRRLLEVAREFVAGIETIKRGSRAQLFMWKLKILREERDSKKIPKKDE